MAIPYSFTGVSNLYIDRVLLPLGIEVDAIGGPVTKTSISEGASGKEKRFAYMTQPRREYTGAFGPSYVAALLNIWTAGLGPRYGFMLKDKTDYKLTLEPTNHNTSGGITRAQVQKTYTRDSYWIGYSGRSLIRNILLPDPATMSVFVNGTPNATFTLIDDGIITSASTFASGDVIAVTGEFFVPVRVADDRLDMTMHARDTDSVRQIRFVEVLPGDLP